MSLQNPNTVPLSESSDDIDVQQSITSFWNTVAPFYNSDPSNVPSLESPEYETWIRAIERLLPAPPSDVLDLGTGTGFVALIASQLGHRVIGIDASARMLAEARKQAEGSGLIIHFQIGDAVKPPLKEASLDAIVCRHLLWTLRRPEVALANWLRLLRPNGRVAVIDGFWFAQPQPEEDLALFKRHYTERTRESLPAIRWDRLECIAELLVAVGFSDVTTTDLSDVHRLPGKPGSTQPWFVATGRR